MGAEGVTDDAPPRHAAAAVPAPLGQEAALTVLRELHAASAAPQAEAAHTLLFAGPEGVGRRQAARWYAALLNCSAGFDDPCGRCSSCLGYAPDDEGRLATTDFREIAASATTQSGRPARRRQIGIDQLVRRERGDEEPLVPWLATPPRHRRRVAVVVGAEGLTEAAANAFLKTLEEPPSHATIVLLAPGPDALLPTVASRCVVVRFRPVEAPAEAWSALHPHPALRLGRPGALTGDEASFAPVRDAAAALVTALDGSLAASFEATARLAEHWESGNDLVPGLLREHARSRGSAAYAAADRAIDAAEAALEASAHRGLVLKRLALELRRIWRTTRSEP